MTTYRLLRSGTNFLKLLSTIILWLICSLFFYAKLAPMSSQILQQLQEFYEIGPCNLVYFLVRDKQHASYLKTCLFQRLACCLCSLIYCDNKGLTHDLMLMR